MTVTCVVCTKTVYPMEMVKIEDAAMHRTCLKCTHCHGQLSLGKYASIGGKYYCKPHFKQLFALKGNYTSGFSDVDDGSSSSHGGGVYKAQPTGATADQASESTPSTTTMTPLASKPKSHQGSKTNMVANLRKHVSHNSIDDIRAKGNVSEGIKSSIDNLKQSVSKNNIFKSSEKLTVEGQKHQPAQSSRFSKESANATPTASSSKKCTACTKTVFPMEQIQVESNCYHKTCFRCMHCNNVLKLGNYAALDSKFYCKPHFKQLFALKGNYNEGFGTRPHKELWQPKDGITRGESVEITEQTAAVSLASAE